MKPFDVDRRALLGWAIGASSLFLLALAGGLFIAAGLNWDAVAISEFALAASLLVTGLLVITYQPRNLFGWSTMLTGVFIALTLLAATIGYYNLRQEPDGAYYQVAIWFSCWLWAPAVTLPALNFAVFPNGRLESRVWLWVPLTAVVGGTLAGAAIATTAWPFRGPLLLYGPGWLPELEPLPSVARYGLGLLLVALFGSVVTMIRRMLSSTGEERNQYKWIVYSAVLSVGGLIVSLWLGTSVPAAMAIAGLFAPPAVVIAMFRYRLYDIDRVINRTIVYGLVTGALALAYVVATVLVGAASKSITGTDSSQTVVAVSTLAVAALFGPVRRRVQDLIDRRFYRHKYDAAVTVDRFTEGLRDELDLDELSEHLLGVVEETMQPEDVSLWLRPVADTSG